MYVLRILPFKSPINCPRFFLTILLLIYFFYLHFFLLFQLTVSHLSAPQQLQLLFDHFVGIAIFQNHSLLPTNYNICEMFSITVGSSNRKTKTEKKQNIQGNKYINMYKQQKSIKNYKELTVRQHVVRHQKCQIRVKF